MKTRKLLNVLMVISIALIVLCGVMAVKSIKGPASGSTKEEEQTAAAEENAADEAVVKADAVLCVRNKAGIVTVERSGIAYEVEEKSEIRSGDMYQTKAGATVSLTITNEKGVFLGVDTELEITDADTLEAVLYGGEVFADFRSLEKEPVFHLDDVEISAKEAVFTATAQSAAYTVYVYAGEVELTGSGSEEISAVKAGQVLSVVEDADGNKKAAVADFAAEALSDTQLERLVQCEPDDTFCVAKSNVNEILEARAAEKEQAQQAQLLQIAQAKADLAQEQAAYNQAAEEYVEALKKVGVEVKTDENGNLLVEEIKYCTIEIRCDTILNNKEDLTLGKESFVPRSGTILSTSKVMFNEGETVFDVLQRACSMSGIQLEYSWTPLYDSYYIEGINNLYEFDCGSQSGWMYKVNGWFPNYGCSKYVVKEGDTIVWCYTCKGLGADVGGRVNH